MECFGKIPGVSLKVIAFSNAIEGEKLPNPRFYRFIFKHDIDFDENNLDSCKFKITIPVSSIDTGNALRDKKAQTAEWFDAANYPNIKFTSKSVTKDGEKYNVKGDLTLKGTKKEITIPNGIGFKPKRNQRTFRFSRDA